MFPPYTNETLPSGNIKPTKRRRIFQFIVKMRFSEGNRGGCRGWGEGDDIDCCLTAPNTWLDTQWRLFIANTDNSMMSKITCEGIVVLLYAWVNVTRLVLDGATRNSIRIGKNCTVGNQRCGSLERKHQHIHKENPLFCLNKYSVTNSMKIN